MYRPDPGAAERQYINYIPTILIIERPTESYDNYHERKKREEAGMTRVPFGFARALKEET